MTKRKQIGIFFIVSIIISVFTTAINPDVALFSGSGLANIFITSIAMVGIPLGLCSAPLAIHWIIWREWLNGVELSVWALFSMGCLTTILSSL